jgi:hypothetical protein
MVLQEYSVAKERIGRPEREVPCLCTDIMIYKALRTEVVRQVRIVRVAVAGFHPG